MAKKYVYTWHLPWLFFFEKKTIQGWPTYSLMGTIGIHETVASCMIATEQLAMRGYHPAASCAMSAFTTTQISSQNTVIASDKYIYPTESRRRAKTIPNNRFPGRHDPGNSTKTTTSSIDFDGRPAISPGRNSTIEVYIIIPTSRVY